MPSISRSRVCRGTTITRAVLEPGQALSDYSDYYRVLKSSDGGSTALSKFQGKSPVVLYFYPKAGTPGCTKQACAFRDSYAVFQDAGAEVFGISSDPPEVNANFAKEQRLPFPLLTDQGDFLRKSFGIKADLFGVLPGRQTFVIDQDGVCQLSFNNQFKPEEHIDQALKVIKQLTKK